MPSRTSVSRWIAKAYDQQLGVVTETFASAITKVSLSFDQWASGNSVALSYIVVHFINAGDKPKSVHRKAPQISCYLVDGLGEIVLLGNFLNKSAT
jgi:hypothetical protein